MFSFTHGLPIAVVKGGENNKSIVYLIKNPTKDELDEDYKIVTLECDGKFIPLPNCENHDTILVAAPTEAGKTTYVANYIKMYMEMFPGKRIIVVSSLPEDKPLDDLGVERIDVTDPSYAEDPLKVEDLQSCLVVFDDYDSIEDKAIRQTMIELLDKLIKRGRIKSSKELTQEERRFGDIDVVITSHQIMNYKSTREILNESTAVTFFPSAGSSYQIEQYLTRYCGLSKLQAKDIMAIDSRWVTIYKRYPMYVLYEKGCHIMNKKITSSDLKKTKPNLI